MRQGRRRVKLFDEMGEPYKVEMISGTGADTVSLYDQDDFIDLCRGPHVPGTGDIKAFKLLNSAGRVLARATRRTRCSSGSTGPPGPTKEQLKAYLDRLEEMKKRDHRKLGRELELFSSRGLTGAGLILWHPKGAVIRRVIEDFWKEEHVKRRVRARLHPAHREARPLEDRAATRTSTGTACTRRWMIDERRVRAQADELPVPHRDLQVEDAELPRAADPLGGARHGLPLRALRACCTG